jgi:predicted transcriptional regulator
MPEANFTFRVDLELKERFVRKAKAQNRNASILLRDFMQQYTDADEQTAPSQPTPAQSIAHAAT